MFLIDEDAGLKGLVAGLTVSDEKSAGRGVKVWYGMPDPEVRERSYPFITVDLIGMSEDADRQMAGPYFHAFPYTPDVFPPRTEAGSTFMADLPPQAYILTYQVSTWARNPRHDRELLSQLLAGPLPLRWGQVLVGNGEAATYRRLDIQVDKRDTADSDGKRLFRNVFTCQMSSELWYWQVREVIKARDVVLDVRQLG